MHIDARKIDNNSIIEGDICIIGAGAAGISIALDLLNTTYKVILLESGGFDYDDKIQKLNKGKTTGQKYYPLQSTRLRYFGGTTAIWGQMCSPLDHVDFIKRNWVPNSGWPIKRKDLDTFYERAHKILKLELYNYDFEYWKKEVPNLNPFPFDENVVWNKMWQYSKARYGKLYKDTIIDAKNIHLYTYATAVDIKANVNVSNITEVIIKNHTGKIHKVKAKQFILACGSIQNARLLLSSNSQIPQGLGNTNDNVGRYFMEHIEIASADLWLSKPFPTDLYNKKRAETKVSAELAMTAKTQTEHRILNGTVSLMPLSLGSNRKPRMEIWQNEDPRKSGENMGEDWRKAESKANFTKLKQLILNKEIIKHYMQNKGIVSREFQLNTRIEQAPNPNSRITLLSEKDDLGVPRVNLNWELTALDKKSVRKINELLGQQTGVSGVGRIQLRNFLRDKSDFSFPDSTNGGWHHMGTTRMSNDPKNGVVDANCQVHGIQNLHVAGAACFTTSGAANPTLTLVALSLRLSDYVKNKL